MYLDCYCKCNIVLPSFKTHNLISIYLKQLYKFVYAFVKELKKDLNSTLREKKKGKASEYFKVKNRLTSLLSSRSDSLLNSSVFKFSKSDSPTAMGTVTVRLGLFMNDM